MRKQIAGELASEELVSGYSNAERVPIECMWHIAREQQLEEPLHFVKDGFRFTEWNFQELATFVRQRYEDFVIGDHRFVLSYYELEMALFSQDLPKRGGDKPSIVLTPVIVESFPVAQSMEYEAYQVAQILIGKVLDPQKGRYAERFKPAGYDCDMIGPFTFAGFESVAQSDSPSVTMLMDQPRGVIFEIKDETGNVDVVVNDEADRIRQAGMRILQELPFGSLGEYLAIQEKQRIERESLVA